MSGDMKYVAEKRGDTPSHPRPAIRSARAPSRRRRASVGRQRSSAKIDSAVGRCRRSKTMRSASEDVML
jgi:hypothetical protein